MGTDTHGFAFLRIPLFLQSHPLPVEETLAGIAADEALGDAQFAATRDELALGWTGDER